MKAAARRKGGRGRTKGEKTRNRLLEWLAVTWGLFEENRAGEHDG